MNKISVLIPTYKSTDALDLCIKSCVEGCDDINNVDIIVGVDGTYDICKDVLDKWKNHIKILNLEENVGLCRMINLLVYNSPNDRILIINDDNVASKSYDTNLNKSYRSNSVISPNQIEPTPSIFKQLIK